MMRMHANVLPVSRRSARAPRAAVAWAALLLAACASAPPRAPTPVPPETRIPGRAARLVEVAQSLLGTPYRYGGATRAGFDCSGLVFFAHAAVGLAIPRTAEAQRAAAQPVAVSRLEPGDLVFFRSGAVMDHVGLYVGGGRFIHAPSAGRVVSYAYLDDPWFAQRLVGAGRFWPSGQPTRAVATGP